MVVKNNWNIANHGRAGDIARLQIRFVATKACQSRFRRVSVDATRNRHTGKIVRCIIIYLFIYYARRQHMTQHRNYKKTEKHTRNYKLKYTKNSNYKTNHTANEIVVRATVHNSFLE